jgi:hypothetical protein
MWPPLPSVPSHLPPLLSLLIMNPDFTKGSCSTRTSTSCGCQTHHNELESEGTTPAPGLSLSSRLFIMEATLTFILTKFPPCVHHGNAIATSFNNMPHPIIFPPSLIWLYHPAPSSLDHRQDSIHLLLAISPTFSKPFSLSISLMARGRGSRRGRGSSSRHLPDIPDHDLLLQLKSHLTLMKLILHCTFKRKLTSQKLMSESYDVSSLTMKS